MREKVYKLETMIKKIYILLATYNGEKYLSEQIESILYQTYQDWKLWIHDDGSTDSTVQIIRDYANRFPEKICFLDDSISCGGAKENFTYLLNNIDRDFDYIMFCDQDDIWIKNRVKLFVNKMKIIEQNNKELPLVVFSDLTVVDERLNVINQSMVKSQKLNPTIATSFDLLKCQNVITGCAMMLNKKAFEVSTPIPKNVLMHDWWVALITAKYGKNFFLDERTILYRQHGGNVVGAKKINLYYIVAKIISIKSWIAFRQHREMLKYLNITIKFHDYIYCKLNVLKKRFLEKYTIYKD